MDAGDRKAPRNQEGLLRENERLDDLQRSGLSIIQDPDGNRFSTDAVLLSSFCKARRKDRAVDLGTGTGILPLLIWAKWKPESITGLELDQRTADMAARSVRLNGLENIIEIIHGDIRELPPKMRRAWYTLVVSNPPYVRADGGTKSKSDARSLARHEIGCTFDDVAKAAFELLAPAGRFALVHRPDRLVDVLSVLRANGLEPKLMRTVHTKGGDPPVLVLISAVKGAESGLKVGPPLVIYAEDGKYTEETQGIYFGK